MKRRASIQATRKHKEPLVLSLEAEVAELADALDSKSGVPQGGIDLRPIRGFVDVAAKWLLALQLLCRVAQVRVAAPGLRIGRGNHGSPECRSLRLTPLRGLIPTLDFAAAHTPARLINLNPRIAKADYSAPSK